ncbi:hypothetical protein [Mammaliicoccus sciuri]|uniref:hypothetical protein n=1 Tax=Mammaliicoccus sciuri TaxID=1296 RepID=UPI0037985A45
MVKIFRLIFHITIAVVIWKIYKLEQKLKFDNFEKLLREVELYRGEQIRKKWFKEYHENKNPNAIDSLF